jgi:hypothetical protein
MGVAAVAASHSPPVGSCGGEHERQSGLVRTAGGKWTRAHGSKTELCPGRHTNTLECAEHTAQFWLFVSAGRWSTFRTDNLPRASGTDRPFHRLPLPDGPLIEMGGIP